jgi:putative membrane protein
MIAVLPIGLLYLAGALRVRRWLPWRSAAFATGLVALGAALEWPDRALSDHMVQHVLMTLVAPPLLVLGAPHVLALRALHGEARAAVRRLLERRWLGNPLLALALFTTVMVATHLTPVFGYANAHPLAHGAEHVLLIASAILFWAPVLAAPPARRLGPLGRVGYLFAAMGPMGVVGAGLGGAAGAIMWVGGGYALLATVLVAVWTALADEERRQQARERYEL